MTAPLPTIWPAVDTDARRPPVLTIETPDADPVGFLGQHREALRDAVTRHGALLIRGLEVADSELAARCLKTLGSTLVGDEEGFAPRQRLAGGLYSSAEWPDHQPMCMHHELSYRATVPGLLVLACLTAPPTGGATGLADATAVLADLPRELVDRFADQGWMLLRTYGGDIGPTVAGAFGTDERSAVEAYCRANDIETDWQSDGSLRTRQRRAAVIEHPSTGASCWFNQIAFLSEWTIEEEIREFMIDMYGPEGLPFTTAYGDGSPIEADVIATINAVYDARTVREPWQIGDLMLIDNLATAHSREAFSGDREILVALSDPVEPGWPARVAPDGSGLR